MNRDEMIYWGLTGLFCAAFTMGGLAHVTRAEAMAESMAALGFPIYVMSILGVAKLLGVVALLVPGQPFLKEWAYAGFAFDLLGAIASHLFAGDPVGATVPPIGLLLLGAGSYYFRPASRRLVAAN
jgi:hypothetical protein